MVGRNKRIQCILETSLLLMKGRARASEFAMIDAMEAIGTIAPKNGLFELSIKEHVKERKKRGPNALTPKQLRLVTAFLQNGGDRRSAAREAGYTGDDNVLYVSATRVLNDSRIKEILAKHYKELERIGGTKKAIREKELVRLEKFQTKELAIQGKIVEEIGTVGFSKPKGLPTYDSKLRALDLLAKINRLYDQNVINNNTLILSGDIGKASESQLHARLSELQRARSLSVRDSVHTDDALVRNDNVITTELLSQDEGAAASDAEGADIS